jgi:DNA-binding GntR family transcriptional regulator
VALRPLNETPSLSERAYSAIKEAILSLELRPGDVLAIGTLAERLGVSRTPVRDALLLLEREGLVTLLPQRGARVSFIGERDIAEIFELRILLESHAARVATGKLTAEELRRLVSVMAEAEAAFEHGERIVAADIGRHLHELLIEKVDNQRMRSILDELESHYARIRRFAALIPSRFRTSHEQHKAILEALQSGDPGRAAEAMEEHLASVRDDVLAHAEVWSEHLENAETTLPLPAPLLAPRLD